jgi:hypothetical protein
MNKNINTVIISLALFFVSITVCSCDPGGTPFSIENKTDQTIIIYINNDQLNTKLKPSVKKDFLSRTIPPSDAPWAPKTYLFEAKNEQGQIVYSKEFTRDELENIKYKIVITLSGDKNIPK